MVQIRKATQSDAPRLTRIIRAAYAPFKSAGLDLPPVDEGISDDIRDHIVRVAVSDGAVVGGIVMMATTDHLKIANLAVAPDAGGMGIGRALMEDAARTAKDMGLPKMLLATHADMTGTQAFYARLGWTETSREGNKVHMTKAT